MKRILIVRDAGALGDIVLTLPAIASLRAAYPLCWIELAGNSSLLALAGQWVDSIGRLPEGFWMLFSEEAGLPDPLSDYLSSFDRIVFFGSTEGSVEDRLRGLCADVTIVDPTPRGIHAADWYSDGVMEGRGGLAHVKIEIPEKWRNAARYRLKAAGVEQTSVSFCCAPGSGSCSKNWPEERFDRLLQLLREDAGCSSIKLLGPAEHGEGEPSVIVGPDGTINAVNLPIGELAAVLVASTLYIGNDSGVTHLSAAVGARTLALFGPTDPLIWGPRGDRVRVIRTGKAMEEIAFDDVLERVKEGIGV